MSNQIVILSDGQAFNTSIYTVATVTYGVGHISVNMINNNTSIMIDTRMTAILKETIQILIDHGISMVSLSDGQAYNKDEYVLAKMLYINDEIKATFVRQNEPGYSYIIHIDPEGEPMDVMKRNLDIILDSCRKDDEESSSSDEESSSSDDESSSSDEDELEFGFTIPELASEDSDEAREQLLEELEAEELQDEELYNAKELQIKTSESALQTKDIENYIKQTVDASVKMAMSSVSTDELVAEIDHTDSS